MFIACPGASYGSFIETKEQALFLDYDRVLRVISGLNVLTYTESAGCKLD